MRYKSLICCFIIVLSIIFVAVSGCSAADRSVTLQWDASIDEPYLASYKIYYYTTSGDITSLNTADYADYYTLSSGSTNISTSDPKAITIDKSNTSITIHFPDASKTYYFVVTAVDTNGLESVPTTQLALAGSAVAVETETEGTSTEVESPDTTISAALGLSDSGGGGGGCFIATAAFGSYLDPHVYILRAFRDEILLKYPLGQAFVRNYYRYSPPIADFIRAHEGLRMLTRWALSPLIYGVQYPWINLGYVLIIGGGVAIRVAVKRRRRKQQSQHEDVTGAVAEIA